MDGREPEAVEKVRRNTPKLLGVSPPAADCAKCEGLE